MDYEEILVIQSEPEKSLNEAEVLAYRKVVLYHTKNGNWVYAGFQGPAQRYIDLTGSGDDPHYFIVPASEVYSLFQDLEYYDLIARFFPEALQEASEA